MCRSKRDELRNTELTSGSISEWTYIVSYVAFANNEPHTYAIISIDLNEREVFKLTESYSNKYVIHFC